VSGVSRVAVPNIVARRVIGGVASPEPAARHRLVVGKSRAAGKGRFARPVTLGRGQRHNLGMIRRPDQSPNDRTLFQAVAAVADALYVVDEAERIAFLNPAAVKILGYSDERELLGKRSHESIHYLRPDGSPSPVEACPLLRPLTTGETVRIEQDWFVRKDRTRVVVSYSSAPVDFEGGRGAVVAFQDISHRLRLGEVEASRARIVAAADETRRQIERDLHDGAQQGLVSLGLEVQGAAAITPPELEDLQERLSRIGDGLITVLDELREISRGIHPAALAETGLAPALKALARRSAIPVELNVQCGRLPERVEVAAYYLVSEALTNAVKHSEASVVHVDVAGEGGVVLLAIRDDGIGGADPTQGSGLIGLRDRVEACGGKIEISSPTGRGTSLLFTIPAVASA
jgi:PAS domain S-box-containing protein